MTSYLLGEESTVSEVTIDDLTVPREGQGDPVELTEDQFNRASAIDGVELVESSKSDSAPEDSAPDEEESA